MVGSARSLSVIAVMAAALAALTNASAASLGGLTPAGLTALSVAQGSGAPTVLAWENFTATNNSLIPGTKTDGGALTWVAPRCTWTVKSNQAASTSNDCPLMVNASAFTRGIVATVVRGTSAWDSGLVLNSNSVATQFLTVEWGSASSGSIQLRLYNGGWTTLTQVTNLYTSTASAPASIELRAVSSTGGLITVSVNGATVLSHTLSAAQQTVLYNSSHTYFGCYAYFDSTSRFDAVHLDTP
jgi:hypothetical protein